MKKVVAIYGILSLIFTSPVAAQEVIPSPPAESVVIETPTPILSEENITTEIEAVAQTELEKTDTPAEQLVTHEIAGETTLASESASTPPPNPEPTPSSTVTAEISSSNQIETTNTVDSKTSTGTNTVVATDSGEVSTGNAAALAVVENEQNTTVVGADTSYEVDTIATATSDIDLSGIEKNCQSSYPETTEKISITHDATIINDVGVAADSGNNSLTASTGAMVTGNAVAETDIVNIANTALVGDCWFYRVFNIFLPMQNDIILPNDQQFTLNMIPSSSNYKSTAVNQTATVNDDVSSHSNTGENITSGSSTTTGIASSNTNATTVANTSLFGSSWLLVKIVNPQYWHGTVSNSLVPLWQDESGLYLWYSLLPLTNSLSSDQTTTVDISNTVQVSNKVSLAANTGTNEVIGNGTTLTTGNAHTQANILNLLNTSIVGNNWYFVMLNLFDNFEGEVRFARPDLAIIAPSHVTAQPGDSLNFTILVQNSGDSSGKTIVLNQVDNSFNSSRSWRIDTLSSGSSSTFPVNIRIPQSIPNGDYLISYSVSNEYSETSLNNNQAQFVISIKNSNSTIVTTPASPQQVVTTFSSPIIQTYQLPQHQLIRNTSTYLYQNQSSPPVLGVNTDSYLTSNDSSLRIPFPTPLAGAFCVKNWELCSVAGLLLAAGPLQVIERRKRKNHE